tara:strand:- start:89 stop:358 length:270 start_codon:yes stop_codon:yes gene_type:complete
MIKELLARITVLTQLVHENAKEVDRNGYTSRGRTARRDLAELREVSKQLRAELLVAMKDKKVNKPSKQSKVRTRKALDDYYQAKEKEIV